MGPRAPPLPVPVFSICSDNLKLNSVLDAYRPSSHLVWACAQRSSSPRAHSQTSLLFSSLRWQNEKRGQPFLCGCFISCNSLQMCGEEQLVSCQAHCERCSDSTLHSYVHIFCSWAVVFLTFIQAVSAAGVISVSRGAVRRCFLHLLSIIKRQV